MKLKSRNFAYLAALVFAAGMNTAGAQQIVDPQAQLSAAEIEDLVFMREEEKVARDAYKVLGEQWGLVVFANIAKSEQKHMDALKVLLDAYGIVDPIVDETDIGTFSNPALQVLFDDLTTAGMESAMAALKVGGAIEETDILDLQEAIERTENADIITRYENLMCGSRNHLRAFVNQVELYGEVYEPVLMSEEELNAIVDFPTERGCGSKKQGNGKGSGAGNGNGKGNGNGAGNGNGNGSGAGNGNGNCDGSGSGDCTGSGECTGAGTGKGDGNGNNG
jgi:hypothetical protein